MKFCPECGKMLMPQKENENTTLVCPNCGRKETLSEEKSYKFGKDKKKRKKGDVAVVEEEERKKIEEPEYEIDTDAYAEMYEEGY